MRRDRSATSMISQGKVDRGPSRLLRTSRRDTLNFHVRLHARSVTATCRWFCAPLVYQIESMGLVREAWRVLVILEIHVRRVIAFHYPVDSIHTAPAWMLRKISIVHFDVTLVSHDLRKKARPKGERKTAPCRFRTVGDDLRSSIIVRRNPHGGGGGGGGGEREVERGQIRYARGAVPQNLTLNIP